MVSDQAIALWTAKGESDGHAHTRARRNANPRWKTHQWYELGFLKSEAWWTVEVAATHADELADCPKKYVYTYRCGFIEGARREAQAVCRELQLLDAQRIDPGDQDRMKLKDMWTAKGECDGREAARALFTEFTHAGGGLNAWRDCVSKATPDVYTKMASNEAQTLDCPAQYRLFYCTAFTQGFAAEAEAFDFKLLALENAYDELEKPGEPGYYWMLSGTYPENGWEVVLYAVEGGHIEYAGWERHDPVDAVLPATFILIPAPGPVSEVERRNGPKRVDP